jgi:hypothetical protein
MTRRTERKAGGGGLIVALIVAVVVLAALIAWRAFATRDADLPAIDLDPTPPLTVPDAPLAPRPQ